MIIVQDLVNGKNRNHESNSIVKNLFLDDTIISSSQLAKLSFKIIQDEEFRKECAFNLFKKRYHVKLRKFCEDYLLENGGIDVTPFVFNGYIERKYIFEKNEVKDWIENQNKRNFNKDPIIAETFKIINRTLIISGKIQEMYKQYNCRYDEILLNETLLFEEKFSENNTDFISFIKNIFSHKQLKQLNDDDAINHLANSYPKDKFTSLQKSASYETSLLNEEFLTKLNKLAFESIEETLKDAFALEKTIEKISPKSREVYKRASELEGDALIWHKLMNFKEFPDDIKALLYLGMSAGLVGSGLANLEPLKILRGGILGQAARYWKFYEPLRNPKELVNKWDYDWVRKPFAIITEKAKTLIGLSNEEGRINKKLENLEKRMVTTGMDAFQTSIESKYPSLGQSVWEYAKGDLVSATIRGIGATIGIFSEVLMKLELSKMTDDFYSGIKNRYYKAIEDKYKTNSNAETQRTR
ncbi:MAG: hypothetical protein SFT90_05105 [Rickettsiales bacterium]|nr:hypothetical protein [Rickettsiales bacterium]